jgi:drug/metabolite transporter (DMT)-like permease
VDDAAGLTSPLRSNGGLRGRLYPRAVPLSVQLGLVLAVATALASIVGFLYKHRGAVASPNVDWKRPLWSSLVLFRSRWYTLGVLIAMAGWGFHVAALSLAPISLVQATIAGGLVMLTVVADRFFGHRVTRREWIGVALAAAGLAFLAATLEGGADSAHSNYDASTLALFVGIVGTAGIAVAAIGRDAPRSGVLFGAAAGLMWAASDTAIKALSDQLGESAVSILFSPLAAVILAASLAGLLVSARSLQIGPAVSVIAVTSVAANALTIAAGPIVFSEPLPDQTLGLTVRLLAFALVICAAALTPPPVEAEAQLP